MIKLLGIKQGMTSIFTEAGKAIPVTVLEVGPCPISQVKTIEKDGYRAVQICFADGKKVKNMSKPEAGHLKAAGVDAARHLQEFRVDQIEEGMAVGKVLTLAEIDAKVPVTVVGTSKGRGFAGGMKRHGFKGHRASHGEEKHHRTNGSLASSARLTHVWKGKRMSGHYGVDRKTIKNLQIIRLDLEKNLLIVRGSVPGFSGSLVEVHQ